MRAVLLVLRMSRPEKNLAAATAIGKEKFIRRGN